MDGKIDSNERQILKFSGVCPGECIYPTTLFTSLIELSHDILSFRSKFFPIHEGLARKVFTQVEILIIFFEEIRDNMPELSNSLNLCLSVLQFALQKSLFLLEDCTRYGARLYILMKSQLVWDAYKSVVRSVATALDIVELHTLEDLDSKVKESVELLAEQAKKSEVEPDAGDQWAIETIKFILLMFEKGCEPERDSFIWVLNHLGIKSWADCNKEVMFLEDEIKKIKGDDNEIELLSNLVGLMCYCRGVMFDRLDTIAEQKINPCEEVLCLFPEGFRCPISLKIMVDPVTILSGETYDRTSIQRWLRKGNLFCPKTGKELRLNTELVANTALKSVIHQFCNYRGITIGKEKYYLRNKISVSPACKGALRFLAQFVAERLREGTYVEINKAAYEIRLLTKSNMLTRSVLIEARNVEALLGLLTSTDANTQENAISAILKLTRNRKAVKAIIEGGGLFGVVSVLRRGMKMESRRKAAMTIFELAYEEKYSKLIGSTGEAIPGLVELIKDGNVRSKREAIIAIYGLLLYHDNHEKSLEARIVPVLFDLISSTERSGDIRAQALELLACFTDKINETIAILPSSSFYLILKLLESPISLHAKEGCVSILLSLSRNGGTDVLAKIDKEKEILACVRSVIYEGNDLAQQKARTLMGMLVNFREANLIASTVRK